RPRRCASPLPVLEALEQRFRYPRRAPQGALRFLCPLFASVDPMSGLIVPFNGFVPQVHSTAFIAPNATLIGEVEIAANCSIWFGAVLRGDGPGIRIGENSNIQDGTVIHIAARGVGTVVGRNVTVGHLALLHACEVQDDAFIGMHSTVLDEAVVETGAMVAAGAVVTPRKI